MLPLQTGLLNQYLSIEGDLLYLRKNVVQKEEIQNI